MDPTTLRFALLLLLLQLVTGMASLRSQELVWSRIGAQDQYRLGGRVAILGDIDGDGHADVLNQGRSAGTEKMFQLWFLSGKDGGTLRVRTVDGSPRRQFGISGAAGDADGDGTGDYAVTIWDGHTFKVILEVCSGRDDRVIWKTDWTWEDAYDFAAGGLDVDGDRRPDVIVGSSRPAQGRGAYRIYAHGGQLLYTLTGNQELWLGVGSAARVGDVDRDGCDEFVIGAGHADLRGRVLLVSGQSGRTLHIGTGERSRDEIGWTTAGCGDVDLDGVPDFASGSSGISPRRGVVRVFSGRTGIPLYTFTGDGHSVGNGFGLGLSAGADFDRDGVPDFVVGAPWELFQLSPLKYGAAYILSGRNGSTLWRLDPSENWHSGPGLGAWTDSQGPQPGSKFGSFVICEPEFGSSTVLGFQGRVRMLRGSPAGVRVFGSSCTGTLQRSPEIGIQDRVDDGMRIHLSQAPSGWPAILLVGVSSTTYLGMPLPLDLSPFGFPSCLLHTSADWTCTVTTGSAGKETGYASCDLPLALARGLGSYTLYGQWLCFGPCWAGGLSDAMLWRH